MQRYKQWSGKGRKKNLSLPQRLEVKRMGCVVLWYFLESSALAVSLKVFQPLVSYDFAPSCCLEYCVVSNFWLPIRLKVVWGRRFQLDSLYCCPILEMIWHKESVSFQNNIVWISDNRSNVRIKGISEPLRRKIIRNWNKKHKSWLSTDNRPMLRNANHMIIFQRNIRVQDRAISENRRHLKKMHSDIHPGSCGNM